MRIDVRDLHRRHIGQVEIDQQQRPTRVNVPEAGREVFLHWEGALDDAGRLRRCVVCGCGDLFHEKAFPLITYFIIVLAFIGAIAGIFGFATSPQMLAAMLAVLVVDVLILVLTRRQLVCYRCRSAYRDLDIARYHRPWDRSNADRYPPPEDEEQASEQASERPDRPGESPTVKAAAPQ